MELLTVKQAAELMGISHGTLSQWRHHHPERIKCIEYGGGKRPSIRYDKADVLAYIESCKSKDGAA